MKTYQIKVQGRVQGVFYRASTKEKADELGLCGWVRNEADGSVYMELQGNETAVERMLNWCKIGPLAAKVD